MIEWLTLKNIKRDERRKNKSQIRKDRTKKGDRIAKIQIAKGKYNNNTK